MNFASSWNRTMRTSPERVMDHHLPPPAASRLPVDRSLLARPPIAKIPPANYCCPLTRTSRKYPPFGITYKPISASSVLTLPFYCLFPLRCICHFWFAFVSFIVVLVLIVVRVFDLYAYLTLFVIQCFEYFTLSYFSSIDTSAVFYCVLLHPSLCSKITHSERPTWSTVLSCSWQYQGFQICIPVQG